MKERALYISWRKFTTSVAILVVVSLLVYAFCPKPELTSYSSYSTAVFDKRGKLLKLSLAKDDRYRLFQPLDKLDPEFIEATLLYEDKNYYNHFGIDTIALLRAFWNTYILNERRIGASTIVMQVARLRWNIPSHTISGKIKQILRAIQLSRHYDKRQILQAYFNLASYGGNIEGVGAASLIYFNKMPAQLNLPEALTLAVIPQNPNKRNPSTDSGYQRLLAARNSLFQRWLEKYPQDSEKQKFLELPLQVSAREELPQLAPHFTQHLISQSSYWQHGAVESTLDLAKQKKLEQLVGNYIESKKSVGINNAAALLLNYQTMEIEAMVGSVDFNSTAIQGQVNGTLAKRSPGSTLKPFVYGLAMDEGLIHPKSLLKDSPRRFGGFTPENYDKRFLGPVSATNALILSRNVPAVDLQSQLKEKSFYSFLQDAGVEGLKDESFYGLALALGGGELTMMELVGLYSALANQGVLKPIKTVLNGDQLKEQNRAKEKRLLSAEASFLILDMLKGNPAPDALDYEIETLRKNQVAWKTGTSWAFRDAWAVGISGPYVLAVWVGNFNGKGNPAFIGRSAAGPLLFSSMSALVPRQGWSFEQVANVNRLNLKKLNVCANTGDLYEKDCPASEPTWFIPGVSPIKTSNIYRRIPINKISGLRACFQSPGRTEMKVFEFWPSDFLQIFTQAGISLKTPPQYEPDCSLDKKSRAGLAPVINSPQSRIEYVIQSGNDQRKKVPFTAIVDPDVEKLYWFVDGKYEGSANRGESFIWNGISGEHLVRVVDDSGRAASKTIRVRQLQ